jgi:predicted AlkP superfamily pyrophosphatase or phosphodiesterase
MVTGVRPATHSIVQNRIFEPPTAEQTLEWYWFADAIKSPTLWMLAKDAGLTTAAVGWPVTVNAKIDYNVPEIFDPKENPPTARRALQYSTPGLLQKVFANNPTAEKSTDGRRTAVCEYIIKEYKPNLLLLHLVETDDAQHKNGPKTPEAFAVIERADAYIGRMIEATKQAGIFEKTTFIIVSDHGFAAIQKTFAPNVVLAKEKLITVDASGKATDWKAAAWPAGGSCAIVLKDPNDKETAKQVIVIFEKIAEQNGSPINRVILSDDLKKLGAIPQAAVMLEAASGFSFTDNLTGDRLKDTSKTYRGTHGYLPTRPEMRSSLILYGADVKVGAKQALARMIDIAPTAASLLGLSFEKAEGSPIAAFLKEGVVVPKPQPKKTKSTKGN